ncbi:hypothetical protein PM10SUCC1_29880 [Propionigenium maris DSM 9537]|uniref:Carboxypeptidase regulatory-like domain-containing protein n=1 Tax=Propionigenium maris DSM 9537 TaxID=1123000 RepID=A0A9W6GLU7_9FUSO|nr:carboxypeptidase-like regulatory domain-containing protein [Propionigenium maris]GLI57474.1 hypothetical protein PM10SUCC1_29880 [Propionigenium maris DSM 9537]
MLRKFFLITCIFLLYNISFSENKLNFIFNVSRGYMEYTNLDTQVKYGLNYSGGRASLDLEEGRYKFQFFSPDYHTKEMLITSDGSYRSYSVELERRESSFFISIIESRKQEVYLSHRPVNRGRTLEGAKVIFYQNNEPVKSLEVHSLLEPLNIEHGYYDISLVMGGKTIFRIQRFPINDKGGKFINFFASPPQVNVKGILKVGDMSLGGAKVTFTDVDNNSYSMKSDFSGEFSGYLPAKKYQIKVERFGYKLKKEVNLLYEFTSQVSSYNLRLELEEVPSIIGGRVFDDLGVPIEEARVTMKTEDQVFETFTDSYGRFRGETPAGIVFIKVEKGGYFHHGIVQKIEKSSTISNLEIRVARQVFSLRGIVSDGVSPIKRRRLDLIDEEGRRFDSTLSGDNGYFEFLDIPATREFYIYTSVEGYRSYSSEPFALDKNEENFNIILDPMGSKVILQIMKEPNLPLEETTVLINGKEKTTDANGMIYTEPSTVPLTVSVKGVTKTLEVTDKQEIYELKF